MIKGYYRNIPVYVDILPNGDYIVTGRNVFADLWFDIVKWWDYDVIKTNIFHLVVEDDETFNVNIGELNIADLSLSVK